MLHSQILKFRIIFVYKCASEPTYASKALVQIKKWWVAAALCFYWKCAHRNRQLRLLIGEHQRNM